MSDARLLRSLGEAARAADPLLDPRWGALCRGELSAAEAAELRAAARARGLPEEAIEAFLPLDDEAEERIAAQVLEVLADTAAPPRGPTSGGMDASRRRRRAPPRRWAGALRPALLAAGSAAAALALVLALGARGGPTAAPLPPYTMTMAGAEQALRGSAAPPPAPEALPRFGRGARIEIVLRPASAVEGPVAARAFLMQGGRARPFHPAMEIADGGAVRIAGEAAAIFAGIPDGRWSLVIAVGRPDALPDAAAIERGAVAPADAEPAIRLLRRDLLIDRGEGGGRAP